MIIYKVGGKILNPKYRSDLNSILSEGIVHELHDKHFIIKSFNYMEDEDGLTGKIENRFQIMIKPGMSYPLEREMKIRVVGKIQFQDGDTKTTIVPEFIEINKSLPYDVANVNSILGG